MPLPAQQCCPNVTDSYGSGVLTYIDSTGTFWNTYLSSYMTLLGYYGPTGGTTVKDAFGKCVRTQVAPYGFGPLYDPIDCPCCPDTYVWDHQYETCYSVSASIGIPGSPRFIPALKDPIPCITCVCPDPTPPPVQDCETCSQPQGTHIAFVFKQPFQKVCKDCNVIGEPSGLGTGADAFIPIQLLDPIINFIRTF